MDVQAVHQDVQDRNLKAALEVPVLCLALPNSDGTVELEEVEREARAYATKRLLCMQPEALLCSKPYVHLHWHWDLFFLLATQCAAERYAIMLKYHLVANLYCDWLCNSMCRSERR